MQDPAPNTVNNTLMGAHCTSASKLRGFDQPAEPVILRSHTESDVGVSPQVIWPVGEPVTVMKFDGPGKIILGTGKVAGEHRHAALRRLPHLGRAEDGQRRRLARLQGLPPTVHPRQARTPVPGLLPVGRHRGRADLQESSMKTLILGLGNPLVTDDSVGLRVVEQLKPLLADRSRRGGFGGLLGRAAADGTDDRLRSGDRGRCHSDRRAAGHDPSAHARGHRHAAQRLGPRRESLDRVGVRPPRRRAACPKTLESGLWGSKRRTR